MYSLQTERQTESQMIRQDDGRRMIRKSHLNFQLRWATKKLSSLDHCMIMVFDNVQGKLEKLFAKKFSAWCYDTFWKGVLYQQCRSWINIILEFNFAWLFFNKFVNYIYIFPLGYGHVVGQVIKLCNAQSFKPTITVLRNIISCLLLLQVKTSPVLFQYKLFTDDRRRTKDVAQMH